MSNDLWARYWAERNDGDRNALVLFYLPFARRKAEKMCRRMPCQVDPDDVMSAAILGLMDAIVSFDPKRGCPFFAHAGSRIAGEILDYCRIVDPLSRTSRHRATRICNCQSRAIQDLGRPLTPQELATVTGWPLEQVWSAIRWGVAPPEVSASGELCDFVLTVVDKMASSPFRRAVAMTVKNVMLAGLTRAERLILILYYCEEMTMLEIGKVIGMSKPRVSQIHTELLIRLRENLSDLE